MRNPSTEPRVPKDPGAGGSLEALPLQHILRLIEDQGQIGFWWHDVATDEISVSPGLARISGVPASVRRTRESMMQAIHPRDRRFQDDQSGLIDLGQPVLREFRIVRPDGTFRWVSSKIDVVLGDDGRPVRFIGILVDITEKREALRAVEYNQERRVALMEAVSAHAWLADARGEGLDYSAFCRLTGLTIEKCRGDGWAQAVHPDDRDRVVARWHASMREGGIYDVEYRLLTADGVYRRILARAAPVRDRSGVVLEWQGVTLPIDAVSNEATGSVTGDEPPALTGEQIRGARGLLDWSLAQLASASGVSVSTIKRMEDGSENSTRPSKSGAVRRALQEGGVGLRQIDGVVWIGRCSSGRSAGD